MKTLNDVKSDMSELYEQVKRGDCDLKFAAELANITGKYLKAVQLELAQEVFVSNARVDKNEQTRILEIIPHKKQGKNCQQRSAMEVGKS